MSNSIGPLRSLDALGIFRIRLARWPPNRSVERTLVGDQIGLWIEQNLGRR
jgi:hypothetical protein